MAPAATKATEAGPTPGLRLRGCVLGEFREFSLPGKFMSKMRTRSTYYMKDFKGWPIRHRATQRMVKIIAIKRNCAHSIPEQKLMTGAKCIIFCRSFIL